MERQQQTNCKKWQGILEFITFYLLTAEDILEQHSLLGKTQMKM